MRRWMGLGRWFVYCWGLEFLRGGQESNITGDMDVYKDCCMRIVEEGMEDDLNIVLHVPVQAPFIQSG